jgi:hypothetical protein
VSNDVLGLESPLGTTSHRFATADSTEPRLPAGTRLRSPIRKRGPRGAVGAPAPGRPRVPVRDIAAGCRKSKKASSLRNTLLQVCTTTGVKLRGPEGAQRLRATSASTSELYRVGFVNSTYAGDSHFAALRITQRGTTARSNCRYEIVVQELRFDCAFDGLVLRWQVVSTTGLRKELVAHDRTRPTGSSGVEPQSDAQTKGSSCGRALAAGDRGSFSGSRKGGTSTKRGPPRPGDRR